MKKYIYLLICLLVPILFGACSKYLDVDLANQKTLDETFQKRTTTERYLAQVYGYLPIEHDLFNGEKHCFPGWPGCLGSTSQMVAGG